MGQFFLMLRNFFAAIFELLADTKFVLVDDYEVSLLSVMLVVMITGFVIGIYWRGAKT